MPVHPIRHPELLWTDFDAREEYLRSVIEECLAQRPVPDNESYIIATYFFAFRTMRLADAVSGAGARRVQVKGLDGVKSRLRQSLDGPLQDPAAFLLYRQKRRKAHKLLVLIV